MSFFAALDAVIPVESDTDDEGIPRISLAEMLEDLQISEDATGGEGAEMLTEWTDGLFMALVFFLEKR